MSVHHTALLTLAALILAVASPAAHADDMDTKQVQISLRGLDLTTQAGEATARAQITHAARAACGWTDTRDLQSSADVRACRRAAIFQAMSQLDIAVAASRAHAGSPMVASASPR